MRALTRSGPRWQKVSLFSTLKMEVRGHFLAQKIPQTYSPSILSIFYSNLFCEPSPFFTKMIVFMGVPTLTGVTDRFNFFHTTCSTALTPPRPNLPCATTGRGRNRPRASDESSLRSVCYSFFSIVFIPILVFSKFKTALLDFPKFVPFVWTWGRLRPSRCHPSQAVTWTSLGRSSPSPGGGFW